MEIELIKLIEDFKNLMTNRLIEKEGEGFTGWDDREKYEKSMCDRLKSKVDLVAKGLGEEKDYIDIANFAMFLAYQQAVFLEENPKQEKESGEDEG